MLGFSRSSFMVVFVVMFGSPYSAANAESDTHASIPSAHTIVLIHFIFWDILHSAAAYPAVLSFVMIYCITNLPLVKEISVQYGACTAPQILLYWSRIFLRVEGAESYALSAGIEI